ncbi:arsenate reductase ArsC [SAR202 cluster bacterium AD-493-K16_JPT_193m]|nr:arsenate reductase ArsC [SAR202 cluster bacterium AD-493-K16_JPT_193m]
MLFVCVHNSGRSQMARAFLNYLSNGSIKAESAGTIPSNSVNQTVVDAMQEIGIDISGESPKLITQEMVDRSSKVITMGCSIDEACPATFVVAEDWGLDDPSGKGVAEVRRIRDQIKERVAILIQELG